MADAIPTVLRLSLQNDHQTLAAARVVDPDIKRQLDAAMVKTAKLEHYFWTGWTLPGTWNTTSIKELAGDYARAHGGATVGDAVTHIRMPRYDPRDKVSTDAWEYASEAFARHAEGDVYLIHGDDARTKGVWTNLEFPRLKERDKVKRVFRIDMHENGRADEPYQIWPDCAELAACPTSANFYHGSANMPRLTAKTTAGRAVVTKGNALRILRGCSEGLIDGKMLHDIMLKAGVRSKDPEVKKMLMDILSSDRNSQYVRKERVSSTIENFKSNTVTTAMIFKSSPLDEAISTARFLGFSSAKLISISLATCCNRSLRAYVEQLEGRRQVNRQRAEDQR